MTYEETITYLYNSAPLFQNVGGDAYKEGLGTTLKLDEHFGHPHRKFRTIHVGGTNGKGSTCAMLDSILREAGYKVGLYTSPHIFEYTERIKINGQEISKEDFAAGSRSFMALISSFNKSKLELFILFI